MGGVGEEKEKRALRNEKSGAKQKAFFSLFFFVYSDFLLLSFRFGCCSFCCFIVIDAYKDIDDDDYDDRRYRFMVCAFKETESLCMLKRMLKC